MIKLRQVAIIITITIICFLSSNINVEAETLAEVLSKKLEMGNGFACSYYIYKSNTSTGSGDSLSDNKTHMIQLFFQNGKLAYSKYSDVFWVDQAYKYYSYDESFSDETYNRSFLEFGKFTYLVYANNGKKSCGNNIITISNEKTEARNNAYFNAREYISASNGKSLKLRNGETYYLLNYGTNPNYTYQSYYDVNKGVIECPQNLLYLNVGIHPDNAKAEYQTAYLMYNDDEYFSYESGYRTTYYEEYNNDKYYYGCLANGDKLHFSTLVNNGDWSVGSEESGYNRSRNYRLYLKESFIFDENGIHYDVIDIGGGDAELKCNTENGIISEEFVTFLKDFIFNPLRIIAPILLFAFTSFDFAKAIFANDEKAILKAWQNLIKRAAAVICLFLISYIINLIVGIFLSRMAIDTCGIN